MNRDDYYRHYQENLELLSVELAQVKKATQTLVGKKYWQEKQGIDHCQVKKTEIEIKACTRLLTFLTCSWLEARLMKILYENSSVAFTDTEIQRILSLDTMDYKWRACFNMAMHKAYGFSINSLSPYTVSIPPSSSQHDNYIEITSYLNDIKEAITIRNRLAHGQWEHQFNSRNTSIVHYDFFNTYDNVQKLDILMQCFNEIADIISSYVTYRDKHNPNFNILIAKKMFSIRNKRLRIIRSDYSKYTAQLGKKYENNLRKKQTN